MAGMARSCCAVSAAIRHGLSNARVEQVNTQIRLITRRAFGFGSADALIALAAARPSATNLTSLFAPCTITLQPI